MALNVLGRLPLLRKTVSIILDLSDVGIWLTTADSLAKYSEDSIGKIQSGSSVQIRYIKQRRDVFSF